MSASTRFKKMNDTMEEGHPLIATMGLLMTSVLGIMVFIDIQSRTTTTMPLWEKFLSWDVALLCLLVVIFAWCFNDLLDLYSARRTDRLNQMIQTHLTAQAAKARGEYPPPREAHPSIPDLFPATEFALMLRGRMHVRGIAAHLTDIGFSLEAIARALFDIDFREEEVRAQLVELGNDARVVDRVLELTQSRRREQPTRTHGKTTVVQLNDVGPLVDLFRDARMTPEAVVIWLRTSQVDVSTIAVVLAGLGLSPDKISSALTALNALPGALPTSDTEPN